MFQHVAEDEAIESANGADQPGRPVGRNRIKSANGDQPSQSARLTVEQSAMIPKRDLQAPTMTRENTMQDGARLVTK